MREMPALATFQLSTLPANLLTDSFEATLLKDIEKPVLLSELRDQNLTSLREAFPDLNASSLRPLPLFFDSESIRLPIQTVVSEPSLIQAEKAISPPTLSPNADTTPVLDKPRLRTHTPLVWDALGLGSERLKNRSRRKNNEKRQVRTASRKKEVIRPI